MQKYTSFLNKTVFKTQTNAASETKMQPSEATLKSILQFAASYRVVKIGKNQFIETNLN